MSLRPRAGEIDALVALLDSEQDSVDALARDVFRAVSTAIAGREQWAVCVVKSSELWVYGPYFSRKSAENAVLTGALQVRGDARFLVRRMISDMTGDGDDA